MSISLHPIRQGADAGGIAGGGRGAGGGFTGDENPQPAVHQICRAVCRRGRRRAAVERDFRGFLLLSRAQAGADPDPARAGGGRRRKNQPVHQGDREPARLDHAIAVVGGIARRTAASTRCGCCKQVPAITELSQVDSTGKERLRVSRIAMDVVDSGIDLSKEPKFTEAVANKVYYGPVYFRRRVRALYDAGAGRHPQGRRRQHRRGQSEADLGRGLADQGRRARPCLCGGLAGAADRASRHQPGAAQHRHVEARAGAGRACRAIRTRSTRCRARSTSRARRC